MENKEQGTKVSFRPEPLPPEIAMQEGAPREKKITDWLPLVGTVLMMVGALGPAGSAQSRATSLQFAYQNLDLARKMKEAEAERRKEILMNRETLRSQERRVEAQLERQDRLIGLKEKELEMEKQRLDTLRDAYVYMLQVMLDGKEQDVLRSIYSPEQETGR